MKGVILFTNILFSVVFVKQTSYETYLIDNRKDLTKCASIDIGDAKIIGFGALHGSAKTEETELFLLQDLVKNKNLKFYFPETDFSTANYFQEYIETGDEKLLEELIVEYKERVPQEGSIEVFNKWKNIRPLFKEHKIQIIGIDKIASYKFSVKSLLKLGVNMNNEHLDSLKVFLMDHSTNWSAYSETPVQKTIKLFINYLESDKENSLKNVTDTVLFNHIVYNLKQTFEQTSRTKIYYENYLRLNDRYKLNVSLQFFRFGVFHIMKSRINNSPSLFVKLIENGNYRSNEILSIQGFLTKSKVLWDVKKDKQGNYSGFTTKAGYGISDYWLEYYKGIKKLKQNKLSDITLFHLSASNTPYNKTDDYELVKINKRLGKSFWIPEKGKSTIDFIDYAILISDSKANIPIEELQELGQVD